MNDEKAANISSENEVITIEDGKVEETPRVEIANDSSMEKPEEVQRAPTGDPSAYKGDPKDDVAIKDGKTVDIPSLNGCEKHKTNDNKEKEDFILLGTPKSIETNSQLNFVGLVNKKI